MKNAKPGAAPAYPLASVGNALRLLALFQDRSAIGVSEASRALRVAPSTAHRLLAMLAHEGFARQDAATRVYHPGPTLIGLGAAVTSHADIRSLARPHLEALVSTVNETAHLCVLRGQDVLFFDCVESSRALRAANRTSQVMPAYATAGGKALLAARSDDDVRALYPRERLRPLTAHTIVTRTALLAELRRVRKTGYATNDEESESDLAAFACAIKTQTGAARAAVTVSGPANRIHQYDSRRLIAAIARCTADIAALL